jgi:hypothetical protein
MSKQVMDINGLADFIANTFGTSKVLVQNNSNVLTIEPMLADNSDSANLENDVDETKAGTISPTISPMGKKYSCPFLGTAKGGALTVDKFIKRKRDEIELENQNEKHLFP